MPNANDSNTRAFCGNHAEGDAPLERLLAGLPRPVGRMLTWMRRSEARGVRIPAAFVLIINGMLGFLPILGFWMLPLGAVLLAEDIPALRRPTMRALGAAQAWWDRRRRTARGQP